MPTENSAIRENIPVMKVGNREKLLNNASSELNRRAREISLDAIEAAFNAIDPRKVIESKIAVNGDTLVVEGEAFDLGSFKRVFVVGGGKASGYMAEALETAICERIEDGLVVVPRGTRSRYKNNRVRFHEASHPIPDESSVDGARKLLNLANKAEKNDLVICPISGGGSSLMALPRGGISLDDKKKVTELLLKSGARINEVNTVRKHLSRFKGGHLAKAASPATVVGLLLSDVVGDPVDVIASGPTVADSTTFNDAINVMKKYNLWGSIPEAVRIVLQEGVRGTIPETPKVGDSAFEKVHNFLVGNNRLACLATMDKLRKLGLKTLFLTSLLEGEARDVGVMLSSLGREILLSGNPVQPPVGVVVGGETTVRVTGKGKGGRNQEVALAASLKIDRLDRISIVSVSTDGIDGPTDAAGAIADGNTILRSVKLNMDAQQYLVDNDSYSFFSKLGDLIITGPTGTNVNDLAILIVL